MKNTMLLILLCGLLLSPRIASQELKQSFELYAMGTNIDGDGGVGRVTGLPVDVDFKTILENLELGGLFHYELVHPYGWGTAIDYAFVDMGKSSSLPDKGFVDAGVRQGVLEALVTRSYFNGEEMFRYFGGIRWWDNDIDLDLDLLILPGDNKIRISEDWVDFVVGFTWKTPMSKTWRFAFNADFGAGGSDFTTSAWAGFYYQLGKNWELDLRYKATWVDYKDGKKGQPGYFEYDTTTHGAIIGFIYHF